MGLAGAVGRVSGTLQPYAYIGRHPKWTAELCLICQLETGIGKGPKVLHGLAVGVELSYRWCYVWEHYFRVCAAGRLALP